MSGHNSRSTLAGYRAELMAQLFFQELGPMFVSQPTTTDLGYDLLVGFPNPKGGINNFIVQVKATERPPGSHFQLPRNAFDRVAHSNLPGMLLVADVKQNRLYYAWLTPKEGNIKGGSVSIPLTKVDDVIKRELKKQIERMEAGVAIAG